MWHKTEFVSRSDRRINRKRELTLLFIFFMYLVPAECAPIVVHSSIQEINNSTVTISMPRSELFLTQALTQALTLQSRPFNYLDMKAQLNVGCDYENNQLHILMKLKPAQKRLVSMEFGVPGGEKARVAVDERREADQESLQFLRIRHMLSNGPGIEVVLSAQDGAGDTSVLLTGATERQQGMPNEIIFRGLVPLGSGTDQVQAALTRFLSSEGVMSLTLHELRNGSITEVGSASRNSGEVTYKWSVPARSLVKTIQGEYMALRSPSFHNNSLQIHAFGEENWLKQPYMGMAVLPSEEVISEGRSVENLQVKAEWVSLLGANKKLFSIRTKPFFGSAVSCSNGLGNNLGLPAHCIGSGPSAVNASLPVSEFFKGEVVSLTPHARAVGWNDSYTVLIKVKPEPGGLLRKAVELRQRVPFLSSVPDMGRFDKKT